MFLNVSRWSWLLDGMVGGGVPGGVLGEHGESPGRVTVAALDGAGSCTLVGHVEVLADAKLDEEIAQRLDVDVLLVGVDGEPLDAGGLLGLE